MSSNSPTLAKQSMAPPLMIPPPLELDTATTANWSAPLYFHNQLKWLFIITKFELSFATFVPWMPMVRLSFSSWIAYASLVQYHLPILKDPTLYGNFFCWCKVAPCHSSYLDTRCLATLHYVADLRLARILDPNNNEKDQIRTTTNLPILYHSFNSIFIDNNVVFLCLEYSFEFIWIRCNFVMKQCKILM